MSHLWQTKSGKKCCILVHQKPQNVWLKLQFLSPSFVEMFAEVCVSRTWLLYILEYCCRCWMQKSSKLQRSQIWQNFWPAHLPTFWISHRCALLRCTLMSLCGWCCLETDPIIECQTHSKPCLNLNHSSLVAVLNVDDDYHYLRALTKFGRIGIPSLRVCWISGTKRW